MRRQKNIIFVTLTCGFGDVKSSRFIDCVTKIIPSAKGIMNVRTQIASAMVENYIYRRATIHVYREL